MGRAKALPEEYDSFVGEMAILLKAPIDVPVTLRTIKRLIDTPGLKIMKTEGSEETGFKVFIITEVPISITATFLKDPGITSYTELSIEETDITEASLGRHLKGIEITTK